MLLTSLRGLSCFSAAAAAVGVQYKRQSDAGAAAVSLRPTVYLCIVYAWACAVRACTLFRIFHRAPEISCGLPPVIAAAFLLHEISAGLHSTPAATGDAFRQACCIDAERVANGTGHAAFALSRTLRLMRRRRFIAVCTRACWAYCASARKRRRCLAGCGKHRARMPPCAATWHRCGLYRHAATACGNLARRDIGEHLSFVFPAG